MSLFDGCSNHNVLAEHDFKEIDGRHFYPIIAEQIIMFLHRISIRRELMGFLVKFSIISLMAWHLWTVYNYSPDLRDTHQIVHVMQGGFTTAPMSIHCTNNCPCTC